MGRSRCAASYRSNSPRTPQRSSGKTTRSMPAGLARTAIGSARLRLQGAQEDQLGRVGRTGISALTAAISAGAADLDPVGGAVERATMAPRVDEGLEQENRMPERLEPIGAQAPLAQREDARGDIRTVPGGQNAISGVISQQPHPLLAPARHIPQRLANLPQRPEVVVRLHQLLEASALLGPYPPHLDILEHKPPSLGAPYTASRRGCSARAEPPLSIRPLAAGLIHPAPQAPTGCAARVIRYHRTRGLRRPAEVAGADLKVVRMILARERTAGMRLSPSARSASGSASTHACPAAVSKGVNFLEWLRNSGSFDCGGSKR